MYHTLAPLICNPLKEARKGIAFRYPLAWHAVGRTCPRFKRDQGTIARGRYSCTPFSRSPVLGSGINPYSQPGKNSSREQIKAAAARRAPAAGQNLRRVGFALAPSCWPANTGDMPVLLPSMRCSARPCRDFKSDQAPARLQGT